MPGRTPEEYRRVAAADNGRDVHIRGRRLRYVDTGSGPTVVLVHGLGGSWQTWSENIPALARRHRVLAIDLPGFGRSDPLDPAAPTEQHVEVLAELLDYVKVDSAVLVGHSLGGLVATMFAEKLPHRTRALVLVSAGSVALGRTRLAAIGLGFGVFDAVVRTTPLLDLVASHARLRWLFLRGMVQRPESLSAELAREVIPAMQSPGFADAVHSGVAIVRRAAPVAVRCPTMLIWGRDDHVVPLATAHVLRRAIAGARLAVLDDVGHCAMFEWPQAFDQIVLEFLESLQSPSGARGAPDRLEPVDWFPRPRHPGPKATVLHLFTRSSRRLWHLARWWIKTPDTALHETARPRPRQESA